MARKRKGKNPGSVAVRRLADKKSGPRADSGAANGEPDPTKRIIEFPKPPATDDVISDRIIFEVGDDRFAIHWTAAIERLPPAGPVAVERKPLAEIGPLSSRSATGIQNVRRSRRRTDPVRVREPKR
jgi:hypothetical protein